MSEIFISAKNPRLPTLTPIMGMLFLKVYRAALRKVPSPPIEIKHFMESSNSSFET